MTVPAAAARAVGARAAARGAGGRAAAARGTTARGTAARRQVARAPITSDMNAEQVNEELQHRRQARAAAPVDEDLVDEAAPTGPPPASPGGGLSAPAMPAAATTGSGFLLGVFAWALGLAYLQDGSAGVRRFLAAKFFNKTS